MRHFHAHRLAGDLDILVAPVELVGLAGTKQQRDPKDSPKPEPREQKSPGSEKERISREEAMRILDAMKEQDRPPKDQLKAPPPDRRPEKDW